MLCVTIYIVIEAIDRLKNPQNVTGFYVMVLALIGVAVNLIVAKMLHHHGEEHGVKIISIIVLLFCMCWVICWRQSLL